MRFTLGLSVGVIVAISDGGPSGAVTLALVLAGTYLVASTAVAAVPHLRRLTRTRICAVLDVLVLCALATIAGSSHAPLLLFLCAVPLGYSLTLPPAALAGTTAAAISGAFVVWAAAAPLGAEGVSDGHLLLVAFALGWCGVIACLIAIERERRSDRIDELSGTLQELIGQVLSAEETERQRVADLLHDDVLQLLMVTRHDVTDALDGDLDALPSAGTGIDAATRHLRETIGGLRTDGVGADRLGDGLRMLAEQSARRRGFAVDVDVASPVGDRRHPLLLSLARDLLRTIERDSAATAVALTLHEDGSELVLRLDHDDPRHELPVRVDTEPVALAPIEQRARATGGSLSTEREPDGARRLTVRLPDEDPAWPHPALPEQFIDFSPPRRGGSRRRHRPPNPTHKAPHDVQSR